MAGPLDGVVTTEEVKRQVRRYDKLKEERGNFEGNWQEVVQLVHTGRGDFTTKWSPGAKRNLRIYDSTAPLSLGKFAAGLQTWLTPPETPWFVLTTQDFDQLNDEDSMFWLADSTERMRRRFNSTSTKFNSGAHELYQDVGGFGTGSMFVDSSGGRLTFRTRHLGETIFAENDDGDIDTAFRRFEFSFRQAWQSWGKDSLSDVMNRRSRGTNEDNMFDVLHIIIPNEDFRGQGLVNQNFPWLSLYVEYDTKHVIATGGFRKFPFLVPRWSKLVGELYGRSPALHVMPDIKMVNEMQKTVIKGAQKMVDPPLQVPHDGFLNPTRTSPGSLNYYRSGDGDRIEPLETGGRPDIGLDMIDRVRAVIRQAFFLDLLELPDRPKSHQEMTLGEVDQRRSDQMSLLAPHLGRMQTEFLNPLIKETFRVMLSRGEFLPVPQALSRGGLSIEYISPIAQAQKITQVRGLVDTVQAMAPFAEQDPLVMENIDADAAFRWIGIDVNSLPEKIFKTLDTMADIRENARREQETQQQLGAVESVSGSVKNVADAGILGEGVRALA